MNGNGVVIPVLEGVVQFQVLFWHSPLFGYRSVVNQRIFSQTPTFLSYFQSDFDRQLTSTQVIIDAVYYNNMKALRCITHSGDEQTGERSGLDETVWITLLGLQV